MNIRQYVLTYYLNYFSSSLGKDTQSWRTKGLCSSLFLEVSVHNWLGPRHGGLAEGYGRGQRVHGKERAHVAQDSKTSKGDQPCSVHYTLNPDAGISAVPDQPEGWCRNHPALIPAWHSLDSAPSETTHLWRSEALGDI